MEATTEKCGAEALGYVCDREAGHEGQHRGYNEQIDEPMFWPTLQVRNEEVLAVQVKPAAPIGPQVWVAVQPEHAGGYMILGFHHDKAQAASLCKTAEDYIVPVNVDTDRTSQLDGTHPGTEHPLAPNGYGHGH